MFLLAIADKEDEGAYAVANSQGEKVLYLFTEDKKELGSQLCVVL